MTDLIKLNDFRPSSNSQNTIKYAYELFCWLEDKDFTRERGGLNLYGQAYFRIISDLLYAVTPQASKIQDTR